MKVYLIKAYSKLKSGKRTYTVVRIETFSSIEMP